MGEQHGLEVVLRDALGRARAEDRALRPARVADLELHAVGGLGERAALEHVPVDLDAAGDDGVVEAPRAEELHRAQGEDRRAREVGVRVAALDEQGGDVVAGELDRGGQAGGTGADHEDGWGGHAVQDPRPRAARA